MVEGINLSVTLLIVAVTAIISFQAFSKRDLLVRFTFSPYLVQHSREWWRIFTHAFLHGDLQHLAFNMIVLFSFGTEVERTFVDEFGPYRGLFNYVLLYFGGVMFAVLPAMRKHRDNFAYRSLGASGAVAAVLFSYILFSPTNDLYFFFFPFVGIPAFVLGIGYLVMEYILDKRQVPGDIVAHDAHFSGALFGLLFTIVLKPSLPLEFFDKILAWL